MRIFIVFLIFVISCQPSQKAINYVNSESKIMMESTFLKKESPDKKYILFYKITPLYQNRKKNALNTLNNRQLNNKQTTNH